jgi:hypothetical protein
MTLKATRCFDVATCCSHPVSPLGFDGDAALLLEASEQVVPSIVDLPHIVSQFGIIERDRLAAPLTGELCFILKPSHRFLVLMATARAWKTDFGIIENGHVGNPKV